MTTPTTARISAVEVSGFKPTLKVRAKTTESHTLQPPLVCFSILSYIFLARILNILPKVLSSQSLLKDSLSL